MPVRRRRFAWRSRAPGPSGHLLSVNGEPDNTYRLIELVLPPNASYVDLGTHYSDTIPNDLEILLRATGVPIDRYSYEAIEVLREMVARWNAARPAAGAARAAGSPDVEIFAVDVSFAAHPDPAERAFLNEQPTSFVLSKEAVTRLRQGARTILESSPEFRRLLDDLATRSGAR